MNTVKVPALLSAAVLTAVPAAPPVTAAEMLVQGEVVDVVPLMHPGGSDGADCHPDEPAPGSDLIALLEWDLRLRCAEAGRHQAVAGYRVYYRWDGRTYSRVMPEPPGATVSLRVRIR